jgi:copper oxidase (laccase) domain-containing protein
VSLNVGVGSKDDPAAVTENRRRCAAHFGQPLQRLATCYQTHSADAWIVTASDPAGRAEGDALVTDRVGLVCGALSADCAPVLLADPEARIVASAHAGWRGALGGIVANAVASMERLGPAGTASSPPSALASAPALTRSAPSSTPPSPPTIPPTTLLHPRL